MTRRAGAVLIGALTAALAFPVAASAGGSCSGHMGETLTDERGSVVRMRDNCFDPIVLRVDAGESVRWVNADPATHALGGVAGTFGDMHSEVEPGASVTHRFDREGVYPYVCILHPGMAGAIVVGDGEGKAGAALTAVTTGAGERGSGGGEAAASAPESSADGVTRLALAGAFVVVVAVAVALARLVARGRAASRPSGP